MLSTSTCPAALAGTDPPAPGREPRSARAGPACRLHREGGSKPFPGALCPARRPTPPGGIGEPGAIRAARPAQPSRRLNRPRASRPRSTAVGRPSARRRVCFHRSGSASRHSSMLHVVWIGRRGVNSSPQTTHRRGSLQSNGTGRRRGSCTASSFANSRRLSSSATFGPPSPSPAPRRALVVAISRGPPPARHTPTSAHWDILITSASSWFGRRDDRVSPRRSSPGNRCFRVLRGSFFRLPFPAVPPPLDLFPWSPPIEPGAHRPAPPELPDHEDLSRNGQWAVARR